VKAARLQVELLKGKYERRTAVVRAAREEQKQPHLRILGGAGKKRMSFLSKQFKM